MLFWNGDENDIYVDTGSGCLLCTNNHPCPTSTPTPTKTAAVTPTPTKTPTPTHTTTPTVTVTPTLATTYTVTGESNGCEAIATVTVDVSPCTGIRDLSANTLNVSLAPNPTHDVFTITIEKTTQVVITNAIGQVVYNQTLEAGKQTINISNEATGLYVVKVTQGNLYQTIKLIKE